jgi:hypothetical protein
MRQARAMVLTMGMRAIGAGIALMALAGVARAQQKVSDDVIKGAMTKDASDVVTKSGGVAGVSRHPFPNADFSSFLLSAQSSGADVIALANGGQDTITAIKGQIRPDGKFAHDMLLLEVKKPQQAKEPSDYYQVKGVISAAEASFPLSQSKCKLVQRSTAPSSNRNPS